MECRPSTTARHARCGPDRRALRLIGALRGRARRLAALVGVLAGVTVPAAECGAVTRASPHPPGPAPAARVVKLPLPGANGLVVLDYMAYDDQHGVVWLPAGNLGTVIAVDVTTDRMTTVTGFRTGEVELLGKKRVMGPSSVTLGDGTVYVGNRGDSTICTIDAADRQLLGCVAVGDVSDGLAAAPDAVVYIGATREVWVTTGAPPLGVGAADRSLLVLDASDPRHLKPKSRIAVGGSAEGYAVDGERGIFYTNLEESGETIAVDVRRRQVVSRWRSGCSAPTGIALDAARRYLFVACVDHVIELDAGHGGKVLGSIRTGGGLDNIDYSARSRTLYAAASEQGVLTVAHVGDSGAMQRRVTIATVKGARTVVAGPGSTAYLIDPYGGSLLKIDWRAAP